MIASFAISIWWFSTNISYLFKNRIKKEIKLKNNISYSDFDCFKLYIYIGFITWMYFEYVMCYWSIWIQIEISKNILSNIICYVMHSNEIPNENTVVNINDANEKKNNLCRQQHNFYPWWIHWNITVSMLWERDKYIDFIDKYPITKTTSTTREKNNNFEFSKQFISIRFTDTDYIALDSYTNTPSTNFNLSGFFSLFLSHSLVTANSRVYKFVGDIEIDIHIFYMNWCFWYSRFLPLSIHPNQKSTFYTKLFWCNCKCNETKYYTREREIQMGKIKEVERIRKSITKPDFPEKRPTKWH